MGIRNRTKDFGTTQLQDHERPISHGNLSRPQLLAVRSRRLGTEHGAISCCNTRSLLQ